MSEDALTVTGRECTRPTPFPAWRVRGSAIGAVITACTVLETYPATMAAHVSISGLCTFVSWSELASTKEKALAKAAALLPENPVS